MWPYKTQTKATVSLPTTRLHLESLKVGSSVLLMGDIKGVISSSTADNLSECAELPAVTVMYQDKTGKVQKVTLSPVEALMTVRLNEE